MTIPVQLPTITTCVRAGWLPPGVSIRVDQSQDLDEWQPLCQVAHSRVRLPHLSYGVNPTQHLWSTPRHSSVKDPRPSRLGDSTCSCLSMREGKTSPGQSQRRTDGVRKMVWKCLVCPGVREVLTTWQGERGSGRERGGSGRGTMWLVQ